MLRERVAVLARAHGLSTSEDLATSFPARALREIQRLDQAFGAESSRALPTEAGMSARLNESLRATGWATGARLAYETLGDSDDDAGTRR